MLFTGQVSTTEWSSLRRDDCKGVASCASTGVRDNLGSRLLHGARRRLQLVLSRSVLGRTLRRCTQASWDSDASEAQLCTPEGFEPSLSP